uniref:Uncharacterized protein n=1 Tax=Aureoumbra lagunensis TaxID=44058 RepID=A0A7S3JQU9_9STRA|mmetsp:Transcript_6997/g.10428  ORF Transcript_6997/g.10428 Transcript_6997/m.10428 type:complete len:306 (+) Transcript_6997:1186-2103(+)
MHILMMVSEFCTKRMTFPNPFPFIYPGITRPDLKQLKASGRAFFEHLHLQPHAKQDNEENFSHKGAKEHVDFIWRLWQQSLWPQLERAVLWPLLLAKPQIIEHEKRIFGNEKQSNASKRYNRFALLSPDAIWDAQNQQWRLEEINTNGLFQLGADEENVKTFHIDEGYTQGWIHLVGANGFPNAPQYQSTLDAKLNNFCQRRGCDRYDRQVLERAAHENAHATGGWYRLFPPVQCDPFCGSREPDIGKDPLFQSYFAPNLSDLAKKHWDFLAELDTDYFRRLGGRHNTSLTTFPSYIDATPSTPR